MIVIKLIIFRVLALIAESLVLRLRLLLQFKITLLNCILRWNLRQNLMKLAFY